MPDNNKTNYIASSIFKLLRILLSVVFVSAFVLTTLAVIVVHSASSTVRSSNTYIDFIQYSDTAERSKVLVTDLFVTYALRSGPSDASFLADYPLRTWEAVANPLLPEDWLEANFQTIIYSFFDWLDHPDEQFPQFQINLSPIIQILRGPQGALVILPLLENIPVCPPEVQEIIIMGDNLVSCLPQNQDITTTAQKISGIIAGYLLEEISFTSLQEAGAVSQESFLVLGRMREGVSQLDRILNLGVRISLLILSLYALIHASSLKNMFAALRHPLYISGAVALLLLASLHLFLNFGLAPAATSLLPNLAPAAQDFLIDAIQFISRDVEKKWMLLSLYLIAAGTIMHLGIFAVEKARVQFNKQAVKASEPRNRIRRQFR